MVIHHVFNEVFRTRSSIAVLRALIDTNSGFTGNEVARVSGMNPRSAFKALTSLENLGIVNRQIGGRDHIFTLNREHFIVQEIIPKIFETENKFPEEIKKELVSVLKKRVYSAVIFGSVAKKEETVFSDFDVCCIVNTPMDQIFISDSLNKKSQLLYKRFGIKLALVFFTKEQFMKKRKTGLIKSIVEDGILITGNNPKGLLNG